MHNPRNIKQLQVLVVCIQREVAEFCRHCDRCQFVKHHKYQTKKGKLKLFSATRPFELISIDIVEPLPKIDSGYQYIFRIIEKYSRYCMNTY